MTTKEQEGFIKGAVYTAARVVKMFDQPTIAIDTLREAGISIDDYKRAAEYDLAILRPHMPELPKGQ